MRKTLDTNNLGDFSLNECRKLTIKELQNEAKKKIPEVMREMYLGVELDYTDCRFGGHRYWFRCKKCGNRCFTLYEHPFTLEQSCRKCIGFGYAKQRYKGMIESTIFK